MARITFTRTRKIQFALVALDGVLVVIGAILIFTDSDTKIGGLCVIAASLISITVSIWVWGSMNRQQIREKRPGAGRP